MDNILKVKETTLAVKKEPLVLVLPYLGSNLHSKDGIPKNLNSVVAYKF